MNPYQHLIDKHQTVLNAAEGIFTWTAKDELAWLAEEASKRKRILEIGTYLGHSAKVMAAASDGIINCWDFCPEKDVPDTARHNLYREIKSGKIDYVQQDAGVTAARFKRFADGRFDMIFIDDGHTYQDVIRDCLIALMLKTPDGLVCGHDYRDEVKRAVDDCFGIGNIGIGPGSLWFYKNK